jgi:hypothetical protein
MELNKNDLNQAVEAGILNESQSASLWQWLQDRNQHKAEFSFTNILYYFGGLIAIGAMTLFMTLGWESFGGKGVFFISAAYMALGLALTHYLLHQKNLPIPAGITAAFTVALAPLAVYGLQNMLGYWADGYNYRDYHVYIDWRWIMMELSTLVVGAIMLWRYRLPFMVMPVAVTLWYMSMDLAPFLYGDEYLGWTDRQMVSVVVGALMIVLALAVDLRTKNRQKDYAFWLYLFGVMAFWGGLSMMDSGSELGKFIYCCINIGMIIFGAIINRRVFVIFGAFGIAGYLGHLSYDLFKDSIMFPIALSALGFAIIGLGIWWQKNEAKLFGGMREKFLSHLNFAN